MTRAAEERILRLLRETGAPLRISGIAVKRWRQGLPPWDEARGRYSRLQCGVTPLLSEKPGAYRADVLGQRVSVIAACSLMDKKIIKAERRPWLIRGRYRIAESAEEGTP